MPTEICGDQPLSCDLLVALHFGDRLFQHLLVELEADFLDMAGLFLAEQIARAANVEIVAGKLEAGAERIERLQHLQAALGRASSAPG